MEVGIAILAATTGYLAGSLSSARLVAKRLGHGTELSTVQLPISNTDMVFEFDSISASTVRVQVGKGQGCLTAILDMLKVFLPTLAFRLWQPEQPYFIIAAFFGLVGHDWPLYYRFKGGRGESAILGGMLAIDPLGLVVTNLLGIVAGWLAGNVLALRWAFLILLIPWLWLRTQEPIYVMYAVVANLVYFGMTISDLRQLRHIQKRGGLRTQEEVAGELAMGRKLGRFLDQYGGPSLVRRLVGRAGKKITAK